MPKIKPVGLFKGLDELDEEQKKGVYKKMQDSLLAILKEKGLNAMYELQG